MAGTNKTPGAVRNAILPNPYVVGPLARMFDACSDDTPANASIKAIWRNEVGAASDTSGQAGA